MSGDLTPKIPVANKEKFMSNHFDKKNMLMDQATLILLLALLIGDFGCSKTDNGIKTLAQESVVVVRCDNIITNGFLVHRVKSVWRDESKGLFKKNEGDIIDMGFPADDNYDYGEEALIFYGMLNSNIFIHTMMPVHNGVLSTSNRKSLESVKDLIRKTQFSGRELKIKKKP